MRESAGASERVSRLYLYVRGAASRKRDSVLHVPLCRTSTG